MFMYVLVIPLAEQLYNGPGRPLIVYASETFGPPPVCKAWLITASVSTFHHSPAYKCLDFFKAYCQEVKYIFVAVGVVICIYQILLELL